MLVIMSIPAGWSCPTECNSAGIIRSRSGSSDISASRKVVRSLDKKPEFPGRLEAGHPKGVKRLGLCIGEIRGS